MSAPTPVVVRHAQIGNQHFAHGEELPPDVLTAEQIAQWLDNKQLVEYDSQERRSLHRLFAPFSGAAEKEQLTQQEKEKLCL